MVLRSFQPYQKVDNLNQNYVINLSVLTDALQKCNYCGFGPLNLRNISKDVRAEGLCAVVHVLCDNCARINIIRTSDHQQSGKRGPPAFDVNSRAGMYMVHREMHEHVKQEHLKLKMRYFKLLLRPHVTIRETRTKLLIIDIQRANV